MAYLSNAQIIKEELQKRFAQAGPDGNIILTMKIDGKAFVLTPCYDSMGQTIEFVLVYGDGPAVWMEGDMDECSAALSDYARLSAEYMDQEQKLQKFAESHKGMPTATDEFQFFSDWHKSLYRCRPEGWGIYRYFGGEKQQVG